MFARRLIAAATCGPRHEQWPRNCENPRRLRFEIRPKCQRGRVMYRWKSGIGSLTKMGCLIYDAWDFLYLICHFHLEVISSNDFFSVCGFLGHHLVFFVFRRLSQQLKMPADLIHLKSNFDWDTSSHSKLVDEPPWISRYVVAAGKKCLIDSCYPWKPMANSRGRVVFLWFFFYAPRRFERINVAS